MVENSLLELQWSDQALNVGNCMKPCPMNVPFTQPNGIALSMFSALPQTLKSLHHEWKDGRVQNSEAPCAITCTEANGSKVDQIPTLLRCQAIRALTPAVEHQVVIAGPGDSPRDCMVLAQMEITIHIYIYTYIYIYSKSKKT